MAKSLIDAIGEVVDRLQRARTARRWEVLKAAGMKIGRDVTLPASTWVDAPHAYLISIGDRCSLGEECLLLAHDAQMDEFLDAGRLGRIVIHEDSHLGPRVSVLPGVEIGPRTIVLPHAVVVKTLPPETVCGGNPAKVVSTLEDYLAGHQRDRETLPSLSRARYEEKAQTEKGRAELAEMMARGGYIEP
jgi:maltose O-acetyltransferase